VLFLRTHAFYQNVQQSSSNPMTEEHTSNDKVLEPEIQCWRVGYVFIAFCLCAKYLRKLQADFDYIIFTKKACAVSNKKSELINVHETPILRVQGRSRSSMLVPAESSSAALVIISRKSVSICNRFHPRRANSGKITISWGYPSLIPSFEGYLLTQRHEKKSIRFLR